MSRSDVAIIIPVYNEGSVIANVINDVSKHFKHIVCVNDGSRDNSQSEILSSSAFCIDHPINMGQGAALQTGIEFARELPNVKYYVTFDADGQHRISDAKAMVKLLEDDKYDIIVGSRFLGNAIGISASKKAVLKAAIWFSNITTGLKLTDTHNGLRAFNKFVANDMQITMPDMAHASEILEIMATRKYRYKEIPVTIEYTAYSRAKGQSMVNAVNIAFDTLLRKLMR